MQVTMRGEVPDRVPVQYQFLGGARRVLDTVGLSMSEAYSSPSSIAATQLCAAELFGHDTAMAPWGCLTVEAEAFGCELEYFDDWYPQVRRRPLADGTDLDLLDHVGDGLAGRMPLMVDAISELRARADDDLYVIAMVVSPFLVACELRDMSQLMLDFGVEPTFVSDLLETVTDGLCRYAAALATSGAADAIMFENAGMDAQLLGPHHVEQFIRPHHRRLVGHVREVAPHVTLIEHNCGSDPYFAEIRSTDVDAISFATADIGTAVDGDTPEPTKVAIGMVDHADLVLNGTPDQVRAAAVSCIEQARGRPFVLSTGCEIPFNAPVENIAALAAAANEHTP